MNIYKANIEFLSTEDKVHASEGFVNFYIQEIREKVIMLKWLGREWCLKHHMNFTREN